MEQLGRTESSFLRLKRTKLGLDDFKTVKVIGKGAFGEVSPVSLVQLAQFSAEQSGLRTGSQADNSLGVVAGAAGAEA